MVMFSQDELSIFLNCPNHDKGSGPWVQSLMDKTFFTVSFCTACRRKPLEERKITSKEDSSSSTEKCLVLFNLDDLRVWLKFTFMGFEIKEMQLYLITGSMGKFNQVFIIMRLFCQYEIIHPVSLSWISFFLEISYIRLVYCKPIRRNTRYIFLKVFSLDVFHMMIQWTWNK